MRGVNGGPGKQSRSGAAGDTYISFGETVDQGQARIPREQKENERKGYAWKGNHWWMTFVTRLAQGQWKRFRND